MTDVSSRDRVAWFRILDRAFWLVWAGFPLMVWVIYSATSDRATLAAALPPEHAACLDIIPQPARMSSGGQAIFWALFVFQLSIYAVLLFNLHRIIHRFAKGRIFVTESLASLFWMGVILVVWPFLETLVTDLGAYALHARGDIKVFIPRYVVDVAPIAVGIFLIALRYMLEHAIALKSEHDLTI